MLDTASPPPLGCSRARRYTCAREMARRTTTTVQHVRLASRQFNQSLTGSMIRSIQGMKIENHASKKWCMHASWIIVSCCARPACLCGCVQWIISYLSILGHIYDVIITISQTVDNFSTCTPPQLAIYMLSVRDTYTFSFFFFWFHIYELISSYC